MTRTTAADTEETERSRPAIHVTVNTQPVTLNERRMTGLQIKKAAIAQGVALDVGFQLSVKQGHRFKVLGDADVVAVHEGQEFLAVAPDDNA